jgi:hypothetical protein
LTLPSPPLCLLRSLWYRIRTGASVSGCTLVDKEVHRGCAVYVSQCETCGRSKITWHHGEPAVEWDCEPCCRPVAGGRLS